MSDKPRFPRAAALAVARELCALLKPVTERLICAGSLRRGKAEVGDVELVYVPRREKVREVRAGEMFEEFSATTKLVDLADAALEGALASGLIEKRLSRDGRVAWGALNKLAVHRASGIPVDFFAATQDNWWNYIVCRTGGAESNVAVAAAAKAKGWRWNPYGAGFTDQHGNVVKVETEADVFRLVGLPWLEPQARS